MCALQIFIIIIIIDLKLGHRFHVLLKICSDHDDTVSLNEQYHHDQQGIESEC